MIFLGEGVGFEVSGISGSRYVKTTIFSYGADVSVFPFEEKPALPAKR